MSSLADPKKNHKKEAQIITKRHLTPKNIMKSPATNKTILAKLF